MIRTFQTLAELPVEEHVSKFTVKISLEYTTPFFIVQIIKFQRRDIYNGEQAKRQHGHRLIKKNYKMILEPKL